MKRIQASLLILAILVTTGCALFRSRSAEIYPMSYDQTYAETLSALNDIPAEKLDSWQVIEADIDRGVIVMESGGYWKQEKQIRFIVKRIAPFKTKVSLYHKHATPFTQKFFKAMDERFKNRALTHPS